MEVYKLDISKTLEMDVLWWKWRLEREPWCRTLKSLWVLASGLILLLIGVVETHAKVPCIGQTCPKVTIFLPKAAPFSSFPITYSSVNWATFSGLFYIVPAPWKLVHYISLTWSFHGNSLLATAIINLSLDDYNGFLADVLTSSLALDCPQSHPSKMPRS